jgi:nicotinate-nucleotide pyrophosphorylase (carboxylating)
LDIRRHPGIKALIRRALAEDIGTGDVTTSILVPANQCAHAYIIARQACVVAGIDVARAVFHGVDPRLRVVAKYRDGTPVRVGDRILAVHGRARSILTAERTVLNFMQRMTGIATLTQRFVKRVRRYRTLILDTRKTTPGLRMLEKYAVRCGGGVNHRMGLYDMVLIKDNHRQLWATTGKRRLAEAVSVTRRAFPGMAIEVEAESEQELQDALEGRPDWILLDNMPPPRLRRCVRLNRGRCKMEASGGITLANVVAVARSGVNAISLGCLTHSAPAADLSLEICPR